MALLLSTGTLIGVSTNLAKVATGWGLDPLAFLAWSIAGATAVLFAVNFRPSPAARRSISPSRPS